MSEFDPTIDPTIGRRTATDRRRHVRLTNTFFTEAGKLAHIADPVERMATLALLGASIGMCDEQGTDGHIVPEAVLAETGLPPQYAKTLMTDGAWHQPDHGCVRCPQPRQGSVYVHDYLEHNRTAAQTRQITERRRDSGGKGGQSRWAGHVKPERKPTGRPPGRPRKHPLPEPPPPAVEPLGQLTLVPADPAENPPVLEHPAESRARAKRGRPRRAEPVVFDPIINELCDLLADLIADNDPNRLRPNVTNTWRNQCRLMIEKDGREPEKIRSAIRWSQRHVFWSTNIKSMPTLRAQYATLSGRAAEERQKRQRAMAPRGTIAPAAVTVPGMSALYGKQTTTTSGGGR